ncbi:MAG TPA: IscS subfamily cysteine desulfurase [Vicinamibacterales bacterium]|nr:IscS subfamily cysteine desulfurase [Vicinamibacterales bacterium]
MARPVYLDYHATTPVDSKVLDAMLPYFTQQFGNAASKQHAFGWEAQEAVERARRQVATLLNASANEIVFTSGASESNNLAIKGVACALHDRGRHVITVSTEHKSVLDSCSRLERAGWTVSRVPVDGDGFIDLDALRQALTDGTTLVSVMAANNEIGVLQPLAEIAAIVHERGALLHTDAAQAVGKVPVDVATLGVDLLSLTAHKCYGPKGTGALYVRRQRPKVPIECQIDGGGHENGLRSGTLNVPGIVGLGACAEVAGSVLPDESRRLAGLRDRLLTGLRSGLDGMRVNGSLARRLPHNLHVSFEGIEGEALLMALGDLAVSTGSACSSGSQAPSHVLQAIGAVGPGAGASIRFGLGRWTTDAEIDFAIERVTTVVRSLRQRQAVSR